MLNTRADKAHLWQSFSPSRPLYHQSWKNSDSLQGVIEIVLRACICSACKSTLVGYAAKARLISAASPL